ncbi:hypothetical protein AVEN_119895-1 [Araneus ventricosus]|uniref:Uncharacterized protein n=1 Tax=Araneus ventricosus TaxID=182803 RepID=A0A4Y2T640_ARAVE|nr:hypothetical protein AVEN_119895-1 [Araneus ventricosus]
MDVKIARIRKALVMSWPSVTGGKDGQKEVTEFQHIKWNKLLEYIANLQRPGEWLVNYFSVIRPPAGQITQPQSCASLHGDDWKRSTLDRRYLLATRVWPTQTVPPSLPGPL